MSKTIYDNTNLAESYAGVTTPLTFSFVRSVYSDAYRHFSRMMGVGEQTISDEDAMYEHMIAMIGGRLYYRLDLWYRLVSLLPGYRFNKGFFERMLGVPADLSVGTTRGSWRYFPRTLFQILVIVANFICMGILVRGFISRFRAQYDAYATTDLHTRSRDDLAKLYVQLCDNLVSEWRIPIANDFAVMVSTGVIGALGRGQNEVALYGALVQHARTPLVSLDPGKRIYAITQAMHKYPELVSACRGAQSDSAILELLCTRDEYSKIYALLREYIAEFGSRAPNELKLESETFTERPESVIALLRASLDVLQGQPRKHEEFVPQGFSLLRRFAFRFLLGWARKSIARREETRLCRSLIFGLARRIFLAAGERLCEEGRIVSAKDVFFLSVEELFGGPETQGDLATKIAERKLAFGRHKTSAMPQRIESEEPVLEIERRLCVPAGDGNTAAQAHKALRGRVASTGGRTIIDGTALVLREFDPNASFQGKILVTAHTDPGWTIVFPLVSAIIVERGGMLSHAAIVARELGVPCIVGVDGAVSDITTGASIALNLESGEITMGHNKK